MWSLGADTKMTPLMALLIVCTQPHAAVVPPEGAHAAACRRARVGRGVDALDAERPHARRPHPRAAAVRTRFLGRA